MIRCGQCGDYFNGTGDFYSETKHPQCFQGIYRAFGWQLVEGINDNGTQWERRKHAQ
jgi:hypothetical protein